jgi:rhodanese-related sulfurtransferase
MTHTKNNFHIHIRMMMTLWIVLCPLTGHSQSTETSGSEKIQKIQKMYNWYRWWGYPRAEAVTVDQLLQMKRAGNIVLVDNRTRKEQDVSMIPSAISQQEFENNKDRLKNKRIIVYCTIGFRSGRYSQKLKKQGFDAYNLVGGLLMWAHKGQPFVKDGTETYKVHVYGKKWSLLPKGYEPVH